MPGVVRLFLGVVFLLVGLALSISLIGLLIGVVLIILGAVLIASGLSAREDAERIHQQQVRTNYLLQQQLQMNQALAARSGTPGYGPTPTGPAAASPRAEKFCPFCGHANVGAASFCQGCGKPIPALA